MPKVRAPLFVDPIYNGAADPMIIKNEQDGSFFMFYTQRRASTAFENSVAYSYGTKIGVAQSRDGGGYWVYRGALELDFEFGCNTFWAPEIVWDDASGLYHMYVTYIQGVQSEWRGDSCILHYTSKNLIEWVKTGAIEIGSNHVIDPCLFKLPGGGWRMWYRDDREGLHTYYADTTDLHTFADRGKATDDFGQEGPNVFEFGGRYWLVACEWQGQGVYVSDDLEHFTRQEGERLLSQEGTRHLDGPVGRHVDVLVNGSRAFIVYFVHYNDSGCVEANVNHALSVVQLAELKIVDGKLVCDRNEEIEIDLK